MDFYRINEKYNRFLQNYEKEKRGVTKVPNIRYTDRNKFAFGAVMQINGMNYYVSVSSFDKKQVLFPTLPASNISQIFQIKRRYSLNYSDVNCIRLF